MRVKFCLLGRLVALISIGALAAAVSPRLPAQPGGDVAALKARVEALDAELGREMRRLQTYLDYVDQTSGAEIVAGKLTAAQAAERMKQVAAAIYQRSYNESELAERRREHTGAADSLFAWIDQQIAGAQRWPSGAAAEEFRARAKKEMETIRMMFTAQRATPADLNAVFSRAVQTLGWTRGEASVSPDQNPFAKSAERVINALTEEHVRQVGALSRPAGTTVKPPSVSQPPAAERSPRTETVAVNFSETLAAANAAFAQGNVGQARSLYEAAVRASPASTDALVGLARCQNATGEIDAAIASYQAVRRTAPATPNLGSWLAELQIAKADLPAARRSLEAELGAQPNSAWALSWLGTVELEAGNRETAQRFFARAVALDPNVVEHRYQNAGWMGRNNQPARAAREAVAVLMMNPNHAGACYAAGDSYARLGQREQALQYFQRYLQFDATSQWAAAARQQIQQLGGNAARQ